MIYTLLCNLFVSRSAKYKKIILFWDEYSVKHGVTIWVFTDNNVIR